MLSVQVRTPDSPPRVSAPFSCLYPAACKSASETKVISHAVRQPVFLRSMSAPSDLEMIANEDLEFTRSSQRYALPLPFFRVLLLLETGLLAS